MGKEERAPTLFFPAWQLSINSPIWEVLGDFPGEDHPAVG